MRAVRSPERLIGSVANNINQIARALNTAVLVFMLWKLLRL